MIAIAWCVNFGTDTVVDLIVAEKAKSPRNVTGVALRAAKLLTLDLPLTAYGFAFNHEYGHITRAREVGNRVTFNVVGGPWSPSYFDVVGSTAPDLGTLGGGFEASGLMIQRVQERWYRHGQLDVSGAILLVLGGVDLPLYAARDLSESALSDPAHFISKEGDPSDYVHEWVLLRDGFVRIDSLRTQARSTRRGSWINVLDWTFLMSVRGIGADYIWNGKRSIPAKWLTIGRVNLAPALRYQLSPEGPERQVQTYFKIGAARGRAYARWTDRLGGARLIGAGGSWTFSEVAHIWPSLILDVWKDHAGHRGFRAEVLATTTHWPSQRAKLTVALGGKSEGYLSGFGLKSGLHGSVGLLFRFD